MKTTFENEVMTIVLFRDTKEIIIYTPTGENLLTMDISSARELGLALTNIVNNQFEV